MTDFVLTVLKVGSPTAKGTLPLIVTTPAGVLLAGYAKAGTKVEVGNELPSSVLSFDHGQGRFWVWVG